MDFNFLYKTLDNLNGNINDRYFTQRDDGYKYTSFYEYKMASNAKTFFGELVKQLDDRDPATGKGKYSYDKEGDYIDYEATNANKGPYAQKLLLLDEKWNNYKQEHENEFNIQERIDNSDSNELSISEFNPDIKCSLEDAIQAYWCAGEILKKYDSKTGSEYDKLPKISALVSKEEFKEKHNNIKNQYRQELNIPEDDEFKVTYHDVKPRIKGGRHPEPSDDTYFEEYSKEFTKFLLEN